MFATFFHHQHKWREKEMFFERPLIVTILVLPISNFLYKIEQIHNDQKLQFLLEIWLANHIFHKLIHRHRVNKNVV